MKLKVVLLLLITCNISLGQIMSGGQPNPMSDDLVCWLKADALTGMSNGDPVTIWPDSSDNAINFTGGYLGDSTNVPTYASSAINGMPAVEFNISAKQWLIHDTGVIALDGPLTMIAVVNSIDVPVGTTGAIVSFNRSDNGYHQSTLYSYGPTTLQTSSRTGKSGDGSNTNSTIDHSYGGQAFIAAGTFDNGIYPDLGVHVPNVNGVFGDIPAPARSASFDRISVGIMSRQLVGNFHSPLDGYVSEVLIFNKVLSEAELNEVGYYLEQKYSLTTEYKATAGYSIETDGSTLVREKNATSDTFDVVLATAPTSAVTVTVQPEPNDIVLAGAAGPGLSIDLTFNSTNWDQPQTVTVTADDDTLAEPEEVNKISFSVASADTNLNGGFIAPVYVTIIDNDSAGIIMNIGDGVAVNEQGPTSDTYTVTLVGAPTQNVFIELSDAANPDQVQISPVLLTFTSSDFDQPQTVTVTAIDDSSLEYQHQTQIVATVTSADLSYDAFEADNVTVSIADNECGAWGYYDQDLNHDCYVNLIDFAEIAAAWLDCSNPQDTACQNP